MGQVTEITKAIESVDGVKECFIHPLLAYANGDIKIVKKGKMKIPTVKIPIEIVTEDLFENPESIPMGKDGWKLVPLLVFVETEETE